MSRALGLALLSFAVAAGSACASARAEAPVVLQPLEVPPVPARVIVPEIDETATAEDETPATSTRPSPSRPAEPAKPAEKPETPAPAPSAPAEAPRVRTPQTANDEQAERQVRSILGRADGTLKNVDYRALSAAARQQYDTARRFITQAESALRIRNYVFARNLADKAETLARQLGK
jgi:outer membrane biosynthesis protein TonB